MAISTNKHDKHDKQDKSEVKSDDKKQSKKDTLKLIAVGHSFYVCPYSGVRVSMDKATTIYGEPSPWLKTQIEAGLIKQVDD